MLDDFHDRKRIEVAQAAIAIRERSLPEIDTSALAWRHLVEPQATRRRLERSPRDVDADDSVDPCLL